MTGHEVQIPSAKKRGRKLKLALKIVGVIIALLVVALLLANLLMGQSADRRIEAALAKAREAGESLTPEELFPPVPPEENAYFVYQECLAILKQMPREQMGEDLLLFTAPTGQMDYARVEERLADWQRLYPLLEKAANLPHFQFEFEWGERGLVAEVGNLRNLTRYLEGEARLAAYKGNTEKAFQSCLLSYKLVSHLQRRPLLPTSLVAVAIQYISSRTVMELLKDQPAIKKEDLVTFLKRLPALDNEEAFTRALFAERLTGLKMMESTGGPSGNRIIFSYPIEAYGKMIELSRKPYFELSADDIKSVLSERYTGWFAGLARLLIPAYTSIHLQAARATASYDALKLVIALRIYKLRTGSYPETLKPLEEILGELPKDPFTGKDFVYERKGEGFRILRGNDPKDERKEKDRYWQLDF